MASRVRVFFQLLVVVLWASYSHGQVASFIESFDGCTLEGGTSENTTVVCPQGRYEGRGGNITVGNNKVTLGPGATLKVTHEAPEGLFFKLRTLSLSLQTSGTFQNGDACGAMIEYGDVTARLEQIYDTTRNVGDQGLPFGVLFVIQRPNAPFAPEVNLILHADLRDPDTGETCIFSSYGLIGTLSPAPTPLPTGSPTLSPSQAPTKSPTPAAPSYSPTTKPTVAPTSTTPTEIPGGAALWIGVASAGGFAAALGGFGVVMAQRKRKQNRMVQAQILDGMAEATPVATAVGKRPSGISGILQEYVPFMRGSQGPWAQEVETTESLRHSSTTLPRPEFIRQFTDRMDMLEVSSQRSRRGSEFSHFDDLEDEEEDEAFNDFDITDYYEDGDDDEDDSVNFGSTKSTTSI